MRVGILAMGATNNSIAGNFVLGMANLVFPGYTVQRWQTVLVAYLVSFLSTGINLWGAHLLNRISRFMLIWNVGSFLIVMIVLLATNDKKQSASFVFQEFQNTTGWGSSMAAIVGILQACFGMCCYEAPSHMTEEMNSASKEAPKAIIMSVALGAVTGFAFLLTLCFCIGNIGDTASSSTGVPVIQIIYDSTGSIAGTVVLSSMITVIVIASGNSLLAEGSRSIYAFARDNGLPFSNFFSRVSKNRQVPVNAILLTLAAQLALDAIEFGTTTGFETVISIATEGFCKSSCLALLLSRLICDRCLLRHSPSKPSLGVYNRPQTPADRSICPSSPDFHIPQCPRVAVPPLCSDHLQLPHVVSGHAQIYELHFCGNWSHRSDRHSYMDYHWKEEVFGTRGNGSRKQSPWREGGGELSKVAVVSIGT